MDSAADRRTGGVPDARLPDVSELSLRAIFEKGSALGGALERYAREAHSDEGLYVAFGSYAKPDRRTGGVPDARLPDVSELSLRAIFEKGSALGGALRRYVREANSDEGLYVAFGSYAKPGDPG